MIGAISIAAGGDAGNILRSNPVVNPNQQANAINRLAQTNQAVQAMQNTINALRSLNNQQTSPIRGGGVIVNASQTPNAVPSQILASFHVNGKTYVIDRNGIIFGGPRRSIRTS